MKYPLWDNAEVFNSDGSLALQLRGWDLAYCNQVTRDDSDELEPGEQDDPLRHGLSPGHHQVWINAIADAPKAYALLQRLVDLQDIGTYYAICDEAREILQGLDDFVDIAEAGKR